MSLKAAIGLIQSAQSARLSVEAALNDMHRYIERQDWVAAEEFRQIAVAAFEAMLDKSIASQREISRGI